MHNHTKSFVVLYSNKGDIAKSKGTTCFRTTNQSEAGSENFQSEVDFVGARRVLALFVILTH